MFTLPPILFCFIALIIDCVGIEISESNKYILSFLVTAFICNMLVISGIGVNEVNVNHWFSYGGWWMF